MRIQFVNRIGEKKEQTNGHLRYGNDDGGGGGGGGGGGYISQFGILKRVYYKGKEEKNMNPMRGENNIGVIVKIRFGPARPLFFVISAAVYIQIGRAHV